MMIGAASGINVIHDRPKIVRNRDCGRTNPTAGKMCLYYTQNKCINKIIFPLLRPDAAAELPAARQSSRHGFRPARARLSASRAVGFQSQINSKRGARLCCRGKDAAARKRAAVQPDTDKYLAALEHIDVPETRKRDIIHSLWVLLQICGDQEFSREIDATSTAVPLSVDSPQDRVPVDLSQATPVEPPAQVEDATSSFALATRAGRKERP